MALPNLRNIFASFRSPREDRAYSQIAFAKALSWILSCVAIGIYARNHYRVLPPAPT